MNVNMYVNTDRFMAGMTMKDESRLEMNNMALHVCENLDHVVENRQKLAAFLNCRLDDFVCAHQTHSANVHQVTADDKGRGADRPETAIPNTDALYTYEPNVLLCCFTADCVPVLFYNEANGLIGVIHSGWRGTIKEITLKMFEHVIHAEGCHPGDFRVHLGAALSQEKFEVDENVYTKFKDLGYADDFIYFNAQTKKYHIDNQLTVKKQCELIGIPSEHITLDRTCTYLNKGGFSYRQAKTSGRHLSFIIRKT